MWVLSLNPPLPEDEKNRWKERSEKEMSAYLFSDFLHQSGVWPHGAPFMQPLSDRGEGRAVSRGQVIRTEWNALQRQRGSLSKAGRGGIEGRRWRGGGSTITCSSSGKKTTKKKLSTWLRRIRGRRKVEEEKNEPTWRHLDGQSPQSIPPQTHKTYR